MHLLIDQPGQSKLKNVEVKPQLTRLKHGWVLQIKWYLLLIHLPGVSGSII